MLRRAGRLPVLLILLLPLLALLPPLQPVPLEAETVLDTYIKQGLENNLGLKQWYFELERSIEGLKEARRMFFPSVSFSARYTWAQGGREITLPVGDMLNEIYAALNRVTPGSPYPTDFTDESLPVMPTREQETKVTFIQPLFVPSYFFNLRLKSKLRDTRGVDLALFKRHLVAEMKKAYFNHLKAVNLVYIYKRMLDVLEENLRVSESLYKRGKATEDAVFRAKAEIAGMEQKSAEAEKSRRLTASYFNHLIHRPLESPIESVELGQLEVPEQRGLEESIAGALIKREEIRSFLQGIEAQDDALWLARSANLPVVLAIFDYGFQGEDYRFSLDNDFWSASIVLEWKLFSSLQNQAKIREASLRRKQLLVQLEELKENIVLEVEGAHYDLIVARKAIQSSAEVLSSSQKYHEILARKYEQGVAAQMEYMDAQTKLTNAEIGRLIAQYDYFIKLAHFLLVTAQEGDERGEVSVRPN
ncbi:MAG TPA: TolC family protein [Spirochaetia bacterium]|nr:TolC family protein [Spirochaetia bacterium]